MERNFEGKLEARGPKGAWTHMTIPFDVPTAFGSKARVPVVGTINGHPFRTSIMPIGDGNHYMAITKAMQSAANARAGDAVQVVMAVDSASRTVELPADLLAALTAHPDIEANFLALAYSHRKEFVDWIVEAKRPETRTCRIEKALAMIASKQHPKN